MKNLLLAAAALIAAAPAAAVTVTSVSATGGNTATTFFEGPGALSVDFGISDLSPIVVTLTTEAGDNAGIAFDSVIDSFLTTIGSGNALKSLTVSLGGATFGTVGSVLPAFSSASGSLNAAGDRYRIVFNPAENFGLTLGDTGGSSGDFVFDVSTLNRGGTFTLTLNPTAVPEPATWGLMIGGFGLVGIALRRRPARAAA